MSKGDRKEGCVPRTDAVVLEISFADLGFPAVRAGQKELKGFAFQNLSGAAREGKKQEISKALPLIPSKTVPRTA